LPLVPFSSTLWGNSFHVRMFQRIETKHHPLPVVALLQEMRRQMAKLPIMKNKFTLLSMLHRKLDSARAV